MKQRDYFEIACKLFGIYCLLVATNYGFKVFPDFFLDRGLSNSDYYHIILISSISEVIKFLIYVGLGLYLIRDGGIILRFAYKDTSGNETNDYFSSIYALSLKLFGFFLIIKMLPYLLEIGANYIYYTNAPQFMDTSEYKRYVNIRTVPTFITFFLGFYLLKNDNWFYRFGASVGNKP
jgi:hypothetical protein